MSYPKKGIMVTKNKYSDVSDFKKTKMKIFFLNILDDEPSYGKYNILLILKLLKHKNKF